MDYSRSVNETLTCLITDPICEEETFFAALSLVIDDDEEDELNLELNFMGICCLTSMTLLAEEPPEAALASFVVDIKFKLVPPPPPPTGSFLREPPADKVEVLSKVEDEDDKLFWALGRLKIKSLRHVYASKYKWKKDCCFLCNKQ